MRFLEKNNLVILLLWKVIQKISKSLQNHQCHTTACKQHFQLTVIFKIWQPIALLRNSTCGNGFCLWVYPLLYNPPKAGSRWIRVSTVSLSLSVSNTHSDSNTGEVAQHLCCSLGRDKRVRAFTLVTIHSMTSAAVNLWEQDREQCDQH